MAGKRVRFLTEAEKARVRQAVSAAESRTSGEIATVVVEESELYREAEMLGATLLSGLLAFILCVAIRHITIWTFVPVVFILFIPFMLLFRYVPWLKLPFAGPRRREASVRRRALEAFHEKGLHRTREETGILIFISLLERKVVILGDRGINARIPPGSWQSLTSELVAGLKSGQAAQALCSVIDSCGSELSRHFPRRGDDTNELSDEVQFLK